MEKSIATNRIVAQATYKAFPSSESRKPFYRPELDALRFFAFLSVFAHHSFPAPVGSGIFDRVLLTLKEASALGVPLFFLLSAYLITELLLREKERSGSVDIRKFYIRRVLRIWPLYFAVFATVVIVGLLIPSQRVPASGLLAYLLLSGNWWSWLHGFLPSVLVANLWSISVEEQFYLIWPTAVRLTSKASMMAVGIGTWVASVAYLWWLTAFHSPTGARVWLDSLVQFQYFAIGVILALSLHKRIPSFSLAARLVLIVIGVGMMAAGEYIFHALGSSEIMSSKAALAIFVPAGIGVAATFLAFLGIKMPAFLNPLTYLGKISYGLYVFHLPMKMFVVYLASKVNITHHLLLVAWGIALPATVLISAISYHFFELPFLKLKERYTTIRSRAN